MSKLADFGLIGLAVMGLIALATWYVSRSRYRQQLQALQAQQALEGERNRISRDMHDEVGASLTEIAILGHALRLASGELTAAPKIDTVVLDAPATGHGVYLLTSPQLFAEAIGEGPFARLAREVAEYVADTEAAGLGW